jgi:GT2 family glycosyltransferase
VEPGIDIVVPVYGDSRGVRACLRSVLASLPQNRTSAGVTVVNDASPETELVLWLESIAATGRIELIHNRFNLGFIESMNRALRERRRDALMLNADTLVHGDWIDRLAAALDASPDAASVMPWSNNAEIGSLAPRDIDAPCDSADLARIDTAAAHLRASGATSDMEVPTTIGFAMLMRRHVLDRIGLLDGVALTRGYLEEVDWCLRARSAGFKHLLATGVFVAHKGSASFGPEKQLRVRENRAVIAARYPRYHAEYSEFRRSDPLRDARTELLDAVAKTGATWPRTADAPAPRIDPRAGLDQGSRRIAIWGLHPGSRAQAHVLALARRLASSHSASRLLVFGEVTETLRHTGVVDAIWPSRNADEPLPDHVLASLAGCDSLLLADDSTAPPAGIPCTPVDETIADAT